MCALARRVGGLLLLAGWLAGCTGKPLPLTLEQQVRARSLASDLAIQFSRSADASSRAVMAESDDESGRFAQEAAQAAAHVARDLDTLRPVLEALGYRQELTLLEELGTRFERYQVLEKEILPLAIENSNLKAQRLSFGRAQEEADAVRDALRNATAGASSQAQALASAALADIRSVQVIQPRHIAEADDGAMTRMEAQMASSAASARRSIDALVAVVPRSGQGAAGQAKAALDRFMAVNAEIIALSRRNSDVRSLALSLGEKRMAAAACEESLDALQAALDTHQINATR